METQNIASKVSFFRSTAGLIIVAIVILAVGFFGGMEYKAYQIRKAIQDAFAPLSQLGQSLNSNSTKASETKQPTTPPIQKPLGEEVALKSVRFTVKGIEEKDTLTSDNQFAAPIHAKAGAEFLIVNVSVTNTDKSNLTFSPDDVFRLVDNQQRQFTSNTTVDLYVKDNLGYRGLAPGIPEDGQVVYEVPTDATNYYLAATDGGSNPVYKFTLK